MAGTSVERPLPEIIENNLVGLHAVYEGARRHEVKRIVFASSNHAIGMHPVEEKLGLDCDFRPDGFYGLSKMWGEGMARMYWDKHGIEGISVRIGSALPRPTEFRHLSTWLGHEDLLQLMMRCIEAPDIGYLVVWGVSANTRSYWDDERCRAAGLPADAELRGLRRGDAEPAEPARPRPRSNIRVAVRHPGLYTRRTKARADERSFPPQRVRS